MDISVIIVSFNTKDLVLGCLASVYHTIKEISFEVWLVDNNSSDGTVEAVRKSYPYVNVIENQENLGFAAANNVAFRRMKGRYALLLNSDAALTEDAAKALFHFMEENPGVGMACGQLLNHDGTKQNSIANFPTLTTFLFNETVLRILMPGRFPSKRRRYLHPLEVESCIGACVLVRKAAMDDTGYFDENFFFFFEETDWCYRMRIRSWGIYFVPKARIYHGQGKTAGAGLDSRIMYYRSRYLYLRKWHPKSFHFYFILIFLRLLVNTLLCFTGVLLSLGMEGSLRTRLYAYIRLIVWHINRCPAKAGGKRYAG